MAEYNWEDLAKVLSQTELGGQMNPAGSFNTPAAEMSLGLAPDSGFMNTGDLTGSVGGTAPVAGGEGFNWGGVGSTLQGLAGLAQAWQGMKMLDLGKDQLKFQRGAFNKNLANQAQMLNTQYEDRQRARLGASSLSDNEKYQSLESYMAQNRVSGAPV